MDITKHTFNEQLQQIITDINESSFIAIDGEFTGLDATDGGHTAPFDTAEERYKKIRQECSDFLLIQFGLCAFKVDEERQTYEARPYNFYLFPSTLNKNSPDRRFLCQTSSIYFLVSQGFDFNKLFKEGIPYLLPEHENNLKADLQHKHEQASKSAPVTNSPNGNLTKTNYITVPEEQKPFINNISEKISTYLKDEQSTGALIIPPCNSYQRLLIYQLIEKSFPLVHLNTKTGENKEKYMVVTRTKDAAELLKLKLADQNLEKMELDHQVGFTNVIRAITASGKLIVGHNMFLDVCHVINHFHSSLPNDVDDFKEVTKSVFPRLLDTKLMANTKPLQNIIAYSSLSQILETLEKPPFVPAKIELAEGFDRYRNGGGALHEAGYDAYITGRCFATMVNHLGSLQDPPAAFTLPSSKIVEPFVNKLFLMRIYDIPYLNLDGPDLQGSRGHVFHVTFPKEWKASDIYSLFKPFGNIQISWLTGTTAYVALHQKENATMVVKALSNQIEPFHVVTYATHKLSKSSHPTSIPPPPLLEYLASTSSPSLTSNKRKHEEDVTQTVQQKVRRHSISEDCSEAYVNLSNPQGSNNMVTNYNNSSDDSSEKNLSDPLLKSSPNPSSQNMPDPSPKNSPDPPQDKLFDESDTW